MTASDHMAAVRDLATAVDEIASVDVPELQVRDGMIISEASGDDWIETEQDHDWWRAWCEIHDIVEGVSAGVVDMPENRIRPDVEPHRRYDRLRAQTEWTSLAVEVYASGDVRMLAEYDAGVGPSYHIMYDNRVSVTSPDTIDLGRHVAAAELAVLANATGSATEALDYWQVEEAPGEFSQTLWGEVRGVGRQTVHDRKKAAENALDDA